MEWKGGGAGGLMCVESWTWSLSRGLAGSGRESGIDLRLMTDYNSGR